MSDEIHSSIHCRGKEAPSAIPGHESTPNESDGHLTLSDAVLVLNHRLSSHYEPRMASAQPLSLAKTLDDMKKPLARPEGDVEALA